MPEDSRAEGGVSGLDVEPPKGASSASEGKCEAEWVIND